MEKIGVRELRQHASGWLRRVEAGESFEVTDRGRPVARLVPIPRNEGLEGLIAAGRATPGRGQLGECEPMKPKPGRPLPSEVLERLRADER